MPGTATLSSGYTDMLTRNAIRCNTQQVLARLQNVKGNTCPSNSINKKTGGVNSSVLESNLQGGCILTAQEKLQYPRAGVQASIVTQRLQQNLFNCSVNPMDPSTRFNTYNRFVPQAPCPPPVGINSTQPIAPTSGCFHSRFYSPPLS